MKRGKLSAVLLSLCAMSGPAFAQSTLTLYGMVDAGLRYETHRTIYGDDGSPLVTRGRTALPDGGGMGASFWGLKGSEGLGGGLSALFQVESYLNVGTGKPNANDGPNSFNVSFVGLQSSSWGQLTLGRQYNVAMEGVSLVYGSNLWSDYFNVFKPEHTLLAGSVTSNMIHYGTQLGDVVVFAQYAIGEGNGSAKRGSQFGASVAYVPEKGPVKLSAGVLRGVDDNDAKARFDVYTAGAQARLGEKTSIQAGYIENRRSNNFTSFANGPFGPTELAGLGMISMNQTQDPSFPGGFKKRQMVLAGITWQATQWLTLAANAWYTKQRGYTKDFYGSATQYQLVAGYLMSKRTMLYAEVDRSVYRGGLVGAQLVGLNAQSPTVNLTQTGFTVGVRHTF